MSMVARSPSRSPAWVRLSGARPATGIPATLRQACAAALRALRAWIRGAADAAETPPWPEALDWGRGISVVIVDEGGSPALDACLDAAEAALAAFDEPGEIIVVAGGVPDDAHARLERAHPRVNWRFHRRLRGPARALLDGVASARHGAVYVLDAGALPARDALVAASRWRGPGVAVVASVPDTTTPLSATEAIGLVEGVSDAIDVAPAAALVHAARLRGWLAASLTDEDGGELAVDLAGAARRAGHDVVACATSRAQGATAACSQGRGASAKPSPPRLSMSRVPRHDGVLWVTPRRVDRSGDPGCERTRCLVRELARDRDVVLLARGVPPVADADAPWAAAYGFAPAAPDARRPATDSADTDDALRRAFQRLVAIHRPAVVVIEHLAAASLVDCALPYRPRFVLSLPEIPPMPAQSAAARRMVRDLAAVARYDGLVVASVEDRDLLADPRAIVVGQGCDPAMRRAYVPSQGADVVCIDTARATPDSEGLADFVRMAWPSLRAACPDVRLLWVTGDVMHAVRDLGGDAPAVTREPALADLAALVAHAALVIEPQPTRRDVSTAIPLALANGRVCVGTWAAARGHRELSLRALRCCPRPRDVAAAAAVLLADPTLRHVLERPDPNAAAAFDWSRLAMPLRARVDALAGDVLAARAASAPVRAPIPTAAGAHAAAMPTLGRRLQVT